MKKVLVLGVGNLLLKDDGVGVHAATDLLKENFPENVTILESGTFTQDTFYLFQGYDIVLVLDIVHGGGNAGDIYQLTEDDLRHNTSQRLSIHDIDLLDSLQMAEMLSNTKLKFLILSIQPSVYLT